jgi:phosphomannomutase / phosphoglucomutase
MVNPKIFRQYDIRGVVGSDLTPEVLYLIGRGYGTYIKRQGAANCVIAGDARLSTPEFKAEFTRGLLETGLDVIDIGIAATPVLYFSIWKLNTDGGVVITASHNPAEYNGIKMNLGLGSVFGEQIQEILKIIQTNDFEHGSGTRSEDDTLDDIYMDYIVENLHISRPVKVTVDGGNGTGGPYLPAILRRCGCEVTEIYCDMDGTFPNHHPDPTVEKNMKDLKKLVLEENAEIGLGLDGDADRIGVIDEKGQMLYGDQILNIIIRDFLKENKGEKIIADVKCSKNLFDDIKNQGGIPIMYKTGHANIKMKMHEEGIKVSGEMSGHIFLKDRYLGFDDAIYVGARLVEIIANSTLPVSQMLADQPVMYNTPEIHIESNDDDKFDIVAKVRDSFIAEGCDVNAIDGMRVTFRDGWALCRASNTTPVLVLRFEAETQERLQEIQQLIEARVKKFL